MCRRRRCSDGMGLVFERRVLEGGEDRFVGR